MPKVSDYNYLQAKLDLLKERYDLEGVNTEFKFVGRNQVYKRFKRDSNQDSTTLLDFSSLEASELSDPDPLILQINQTNSDTKPQSDLTTQEKYKFINMQLRLLDMTRTLDFMLQKRIEKYPQQTEFYTQKRNELQKAFNDLLDSINNRDNKIENTSINYEKELIRIMQMCGLVKGIQRTHKGYEKLLMKYRIMAGLLDPATVLQTTYKDDQTTTTHISIPITQKTDAQVNYPEFTGETAAERELNAAFEPFIKMHNRNYGAQARREDPRTLKNAYVVYQGITFTKDSQTYHSHKTDLSSGSLSYEGDAAVTQDARENYVTDNLEQLIQANESLIGNGKLAILHLVSNTRFKDEDKQIQSTRTAARTKNIKYNNIPINGWGMILPNEIDADIAAEFPWWGWDRFKTIFTQQARYDLAVKISQCYEKKGIKVIVICASGQDRTGFTKLLTAIEFIKDFFTNRLKDFSDKTLSLIDTIYSKMSHFPNVTDLKNPGSPGIKTVSLPFVGGFIDQALAKLGLAETNKTALTDTMPREELPHEVDLSTVNTITQGNSILASVAFARRAMLSFNALVRVASQEISGSEEEKKNKISEKNKKLYTIINKIQDKNLILEILKTLLDSPYDVEKNIIPYDKLKIVLQVLLIKFIDLEGDINLIIKLFEKYKMSFVRESMISDAEWNVQSLLSLYAVLINVKFKESILTNLHQSLLNAFINLLIKNLDDIVILKSLANNETAKQLLRTSPQEPNGKTSNILQGFERYCSKSNPAQKETALRVMQITLKKCLCPR